MTQERAKKTGERITRGEPPIPRPVKQRATEGSQKLVIQTIHVLLFHSLQRHHIKHKGAKFQMLNECFPSQFHQPKRVPATDLGKTQEIPKDLNTKLHNRLALPQWSKKWSTVSPLHRHMMHQSTKSIILPLKLSHIRILSHTAVHTKKETHEGTLTFQTPFQGKIMGNEFLNLL